MSNNTLLSTTISACKNSSFSFSVSGWPAVAVVALIAAGYTACKWIDRQSATQQE